MWRLIALGCVATGLVAAALLVMVDDSDAPTAVRRSIAVSSVGATQTGKPKLKAETKKLVGSFELAKGRTIRVSTAETVDGLGCLIEEEAGG